MSYDPSTDLKHWPLMQGDSKLGLNPNIFGKNPFGEPMYRMVLAGSRRNLASTGDGNFFWVTTYSPEEDGSWILERWIDAWEFAHCTPEVWERTTGRFLGPYPHRGEYQRCDVQLSCCPTDANIEKLISWVEESRKRQKSVSEAAANALAVREAYDFDTAATRATTEAIIQNRMSAFTSRPFVSTSDSPLSAKRGSKTMPVRYTAEELGLPTSGGKFRNIPNRERDVDVHTSHD